MILYCLYEMPTFLIVFVSKTWQQHHDDFQVFTKPISPKKAVPNMTITSLLLQMS